METKSRVMPYASLQYFQYTKERHFSLDDMDLFFVQRLSLSKQQTICLLADSDMLGVTQKIACYGTTREFFIRRKNDKEHIFFYLRILTR